MKKLSVLLLTLVLVLALTACGCEHEFAAATCTAPSTCTLCGETEGEALGHVWMAATCDTPKTCETCGTTDGEPKGHTMVEATCEEAKHCEACNLVEGEPLGHTWLEATTETPQTCEVCAATEGERIITDPRFTTAATKELQGKWVMELPLTAEMMGVPGFPEGSTVNFVLIFGNDGTLHFTVETTDSFMNAMNQYTVDSIYEEFAAQGVDKETADVAFAESYGMSIPEYVEQELANVDMSSMFDAIFGAMNLSGVYYMEDGMLYTGDNWDAELYGEEFILDGDTLTVSDMTDSGTDSVFVRAAE